MRGVLPAYGQILAPGRLQVPTGPIQIDWTHPLANGLIVAVVPGAMGWVDIAGLISVPTSFGPGTSLNGSTPEGPGLRADANAGTTGLSFAIGQNYSQLTTALNNATMYTRGYQQALVNNFSLYWSIEYANPNVSPFHVLAINSGNTGSYQCITNNPGQVGTALFGPQAVGPYSLGVTAKGGAGGTGGMIGFLNGTAATVLSSGGFGVANGLTSTTTSTLNGPGGGGSTNDIRTMTCGYIWNRVLSNAEMAWIDAYPYDFLIPQEADMPTEFFIPPPPPQFTTPGFAWAEY